MRLKTKFQDEDFDLGEVVEANVYYGGSGRIKVIAEPAKGGMITFYFETLKGMNEMFEDATEEPEEWYINEYNEPEKVGFGSPIDDIESLREIGFLFKTEKETELAIRKCKAWKRLRDKGFRFKCWYGGSKNIDWEITSLENETYIPRQICDDLDLLFSQEVKNETSKED